MPKPLRFHTCNRDHVEGGGMPNSLRFHTCKRNHVERGWGAELVEVSYRYLHKRPRGKGKGCRPGRGSLSLQVSGYVEIGGGGGLRKGSF